MGYDGAFLTFKFLVLAVFVGGYGIYGAPTHSEHQDEADREVLIEDDRAFWDAKPYNTSDHFAGMWFRMCRLRMD